MWNKKEEKKIVVTCKNANEINSAININLDSNSILLKEDNSWFVNFFLNNQIYLTKYLNFDGSQNPFFLIYIFPSTHSIVSIESNDDKTYKTGLSRIEKNCRPKKRNGYIKLFDQYM